jgi:hypothetical protein
MYSWTRTVEVNPDSGLRPSVVAAGHLTCDNRHSKVRAISGLAGGSKLSTAAHRRAVFSTDALGREEG